MAHRPNPVFSTCTQPAVCSVCGAVVEPVKKHDYEKGVCTMCGDVKLDEFIKFSLESDGVKQNYIKIRASFVYAPDSSPDNYILISRENRAGGEYAVLNGTQRAHLGIILADDSDSVWADLSYQTLQPNKSYTLWFRFGSDMVDIPYGSSVQFYIKFRNQQYRITVTTDTNNYIYENV